MAASGRDLRYGWRSFRASEGSRNARLDPGRARVHHL